MTNIRVLAATLLVAAGMTAAHAQGLRPEVGKPLQQASELLRAGKAREALAKVREADAIAGKTAQEQLMIDRMRGSAAQRAGDNGTAIQSFEAVFNSGKLPAAEQAQIAESLAFAFSQTKDMAKAGLWANKAQQLGNNSAQLKQLQGYLQSQSGDYNAIARDAAASVGAAEQAGKKPDEGDLLRLADAYQRTRNFAGQWSAIEKLLSYYGKKEYWAVALANLQRKNGFSDRYALDALRLKLATGNLSKTDEYMEMAQLSLQAGYPAEARRIVDKGFASGALGTGSEAERHKRLRELAVKQDAEIRAGLDLAQSDARSSGGGALVQVGTQLVSIGQADQGLSLIELGIARGQLKRPEDAKLRQGLAMLQTGKNKAKAVQLLRSVQGSDGAADIGRLWAIYASQG